MSLRDRGRRFRAASHGADACRDNHAGGPAIRADLRDRLRADAARSQSSSLSWSCAGGRRRFRGARSALESRMDSGRAQTSCKPRAFGAVQTSALRNQSTHTHGAEDWDLGSVLSIEFVQ